METRRWQERYFGGRELRALRSIENQISNLTFHNLTCTTLPAAVATTLGMGLKFIPASSPPPITDLTDAVSDFVKAIALETHFRDDTDNTDGYVPQLYVRSNWTPPVTADVREYKSLTMPPLLRRYNALVRQQSHFQPGLAETKLFLKNNPQLRVIATDKNLGLALVTNQNYNEMCLKHLLDRNTYQRLCIVERFIISDATNNSLTTLTTEAKRLWSHIKSIDRALAVDTTTSVLPHFHCIAKIHKTPIAGRPIAGAFSWITTPISKLLSYILRQHLSPLTHILRDSRQLVELHEGMVLGTGDIFVTLDVTALYPSMNHTDTITSLDILRFNSREEKGWCKDAARFVLKNSFVQYDGVAYRQLQGTAMGTNCAVELANIYVTRFVEFHQQFKQWHPFMRLWKRFIDDIFMIWKGTVGQLQQFLKWINAVHPSLKFTHSASRQSIAFLDVEAYKSANNRLGFRVYQKPLNKYLYIPPQSNHPWSCKAGFIKGELLRYARLSTLEEDFMALKSMFFIRLEKRGYKPKALSEIFKEVQHDARAQPQQATQARLVSMFNELFGIEEEGGESDDLKKIMFKVPFHPALKQLQINTALRTYWSHLAIGDITEPMVVYKKTRNLAAIFTSSKYSSKEVTRG